MKNPMIWITFRNLSIKDLTSSFKKMECVSQEFYIPSIGLEYSLNLESLVFGCNYRW
jgi:hypothetical protein